MRKKKHGARIGELSQINADELPMFKKLCNLCPRNMLRRTGLFGKAAAFADVIQLRPAHFFAFTGIPVCTVPDNADNNADKSGHIKNFLPAVIFQNPKQHRR